MKLVKGKKAESAKGMRHNIEAMKESGYSTKRARGAAYGEVGMEKKASRDESKGMKKAMKKKSEKKKHSDVKEDKVLIKKMVKRTCRKK